MEAPAYSIYTPHRIARSTRVIKHEEERDDMAEDAQCPLLRTIRRSASWKEACMARLRHMSRDTKGASLKTSIRNTKGEMREKESEYTGGLHCGTASTTYNGHVFEAHERRKQNAPIKRSSVEKLCSRKLSTQSQSSLGTQTPTLRKSGEQEQEQEGEAEGEGESERRRVYQGIHDEINPQQLHGSERLGIIGEGAQEGETQRHNVDGELELYEFTNVVENRAAPHDRLNDRREVVVHDQHIGSLLGNCKEVEW